MAPFVPRRRSPAVAIVRIAAARRVIGGAPHPCVGRFGLCARRALRSKEFVCTYGGLLRLHDDEDSGAHRSSLALHHANHLPALRLIPSDVAFVCRAAAGRCG